MSTEEGVYIVGTRRAIRELADGTLRVQIEIDPQYKETFFQHMREIDVPVALVPLSPKRVEPAGGGFEEKPTVISVLHRSGWFNGPWIKELGTDAEFLAFVRSQKCKACGREPPSQAAHVRRVHAGAGTGIKPEYSAVPLCVHCHNAQHNSGESSIGGKDKVDTWVSQMRGAWGHSKLCDIFDVDSATEISAFAFAEWADEIGANIPAKIRSEVYNDR